MNTYSKLLAIATLFLVFACTTKIKTKTSKPNVVFILIDDLSMYGVSAYGSHKVTSLKGAFENVPISTPQIDKLATSGLLFENAFAYPICEPTRIALMSGKYNNRIFLRCKAQHASDITFGDLFKKEGYKTGIYGKWKQTRGTKEIPGKNYISEFGWDDYCCFDVTLEGQRFINPYLVSNGQILNYKNRSDVDPKTGRRWYGPDIVNRRALAFIDKNKDEPFFLYYPMLLVHDDHKPTPDTKPNSLFDNFDEANNNRNGHTGDDPKYFPDMIAYMDKLIGNVVAKLDEHDLRENTLIVVMGDNGTKEIFGHVLPNGSIYPGRKGGTTDNGLHVPLIINQKGLIPLNADNSQRTYKGLVDITDIYPTLCDAVGIEIPNKKSLDGLSFWNQVLGDTTEHRDVIYTWFNGNAPYTDQSLLLEYAFNKDFKRYASSKEYPNGRFFDLRTDPLELSGNTFSERRFKVILHSGLDITTLDKEQQKGFDYLGKVLKENFYKSVDSLQINIPKPVTKIGEQQTLSYSVFPSDATRNNIIWESSNSKIASVDKFGLLTTHKTGEVKISAYSWDDAFPTSANEEVTYHKEGIKATVNLVIK